MEQKVKLSAIRVANQLDLKGIKNGQEIKALADSSSELFYTYGPDKYLYFFNYGVIVFSGYNEEEIQQTVKSMHSFLKNPEPWLRDDHLVHCIPGAALQFEFSQLIVDRMDAQIIRIAMFNLAQSIALDHYHEVSDNLLTEIRGFTKNLEQSGKLSMNRTNMVKFIGRALNTQNDIAENVYIFDAPDLVWDDQYLDDLHKGLLKYFDLRVRFSEIEYTLKIIDNNLSVFREIIRVRESSLLEWIIIVLILMEVFDLILSKLF